MKDQIDKEIKCLQGKKKSLKERDQEIADQKADLAKAINNMDIYSNDVAFNLFHDKKRKELKAL